MGSEDGGGEKNEWLERLKSLSGLVGAVSAFGEEKLKLLSFLNPDVRNWEIAAVTALLLGFAASRTAKRVGTLWPGWAFLIVAMVSLFLLFVWGTGKTLTDSDAKVMTAKAAYIFLFGCGAGTLAWFWSADNHRPEGKDK